MVPVSESFNARTKVASEKCVEGSAFDLLDVFIEFSAPVNGVGTGVL